MYLFDDTATTEIHTYGPTLFLHDSLPISSGDSPDQVRHHAITEVVSLIHPLLRAARPDRLVLVCLPEPLFQRFQPAVLFVRVSPGFSAHHQCTPSCRLCFRPAGRGDRKSTRLNSSH